MTPRQIDTWISVLDAREELTRIAERLRGVAGADRLFVGVASLERLAGRMVDGDQETPTVETPTGSCSVVDFAAYRERRGGLIST